MVGQVAKRQAITNPDRTISSIKREMGSDYRVSVDGTFRTWGVPSCHALIGNLHHGEADDLLPQHKAGLEDLGHGVLPQVLVLDVHDGVMEVGVEGFSLRFDLGDPQPRPGARCGSGRGSPGGAD